MRSPRRARRAVAGTALGLASLLALAACTGGTTGATTAPTTPSASSPTPATTTTPPARKEAAALLAAAPRRFDARYRLDSKGDRPDAWVRVRMDRRWYRVDITRGRSTASLFTAPAGLVSCQVERRDRTCFVVAGRSDKPPRLFDPGLQRIFVRTLPLLREGGSRVRVERAGVWQAPRRYGPAQCFQVTGRVADPGVYCLLTKGRWAGALARAEFGSGALSLRHIDGGFDRARTFRPPVRPTPLPD